MSPLQRKAPLQRGGRIRPKKRKPSEFARIYGSKQRVEWVKSLPCVVQSFWCAGPIENAHTENGGMSRKADASSIVPLCAHHHNNLHDHGEAWLLARYHLRDGHGTDLHSAAAATHAAWRAFQERTGA